MLTKRQSAYCGRSAWWRCPLTDEHFGLSFGTPGGSSLTSQGILSSEAMDILKAPYSEILQLSAAALHRRVEEVHHYQHPQRIVPLYQVAIQHFLCTSNLPESHGSILQAIPRVVVYVPGLHLSCWGLRGRPSQVAG